MIMKKNSSSKKQQQQQQNGNTKSHSSTTRTTTTTMIRSFLIDIPLLLLFTLLLLVLLLHYNYDSLLTPLIHSYKRHSIYQDDSIADFSNEFTYYRRHCSKHDISTTDPSDLLISNNTDPSSIMLQHGAVSIQNVLSKTTASQLRDYIISKNNNKSALSYNELFWNGEDSTRLSLSIAPHDHNIIQQALWEIGSHQLLNYTLTSILNPNPAIVELNTLTCLTNSHDQSIHTDSDWFGSSLLYGRTFLHSYSMFVALQDTSQNMGATTLCPGSHYCSDEELEHVCLQNGAFSISTSNTNNTSKQQTFESGDAFLFNQNIWHRGPANNNNNDGGMDRVMLVLTFVSSRSLQEKKNIYRRRQGLGTYYYQRWDMWGRVYSDLTESGGLSFMSRLTKSLGLSYNTDGGILFVEQFAQQIANGDDFYEDDELRVFKHKLRNYLPANLLYSSATTWEEFIPETLDIWVVLALKLYVGALVIVLIGWMLVSLLLSKKKKRFSALSFWKRLVTTHGMVCLLVYALYWHIEHTDIAQTIKSGDVFSRPFPPPPVIQSSSLITQQQQHPTTFPERHDVLIGTRFDADFLASYNRFLDFHPGNKEWLGLVAKVVSSSFLSSREEACHHLVSTILQIREDGLPTRFLLQDYATGAWRIMTYQQAVEETWRAVISQSMVVVGKLAMHLKKELANARFGGGRRADTIMMGRRRLDVVFATKWLSTIFRRPSHDDDDAGDTMMTTMSRSSLCRPLLQREEMSSRQGIVKLPSSLLLPRAVVRPLPLSYSTATLPSTVTSTVPPPTSSSTFIPSARKNSNINNDNKRASSGETSSFQPGDRVWADYDGEWYEANLLYQHDNGEWTYEFMLGPQDRGTDFRRYSTIKEGDRVLVEYDGEFFSGTLTFVHPDGKCSILFDDNEFVERVPREEIWLLSDVPVEE